MLVKIIVNTYKLVFSFLTSVLTVWLVPLVWLVRLMVQTTTLWTLPWINIHYWTRVLLHLESGPTDWDKEWTGVRRKTANQKLQGRTQALSQENTDLRGRRSWNGGQLGQARGRIPEGTVAKKSELKPQLAIDIPSISKFSTTITM